MLFQPFFKRFACGTPTSDKALRIAILSTPRSGNTWLRHMLDHAYQCSQLDHGEYLLFNPLEIPWLNLPRRCILMSHWNRNEPLPTLLKEHQFATFTLARHPLDVLISILLYAPSEGSLRWLNGREGDERSIYGAAPDSEAFLEYAVSTRARALLEVSAEWWSDRTCQQIRYEDLVRNPRKQLSRIARILGVRPSTPFDLTIRSCTFEVLRNPISSRHVWKGKPGLWRTLLTRPVALRIAKAHAKIFSTLGYICNPDRNLNYRRASQNWSRLIAAQDWGRRPGTTRSVA